MKLLKFCFGSVHWLVLFAVCCCYANIDIYAQPKLAIRVGPISITDLSKGEPPITLPDACSPGANFIVWRGYLVNYGDLPLVVNHLSITGPDADSFSFDDFFRYGEIPKAPFTILPGQDMRLGIRCTPRKVGTLQASVNLNSNDLAYPSLTLPIYNAVSEARPNIRVKLKSFRLLRSIRFPNKKELEMTVSFKNVGGIPTKRGFHWILSVVQAPNFSGYRYYKCKKIIPARGSVSVKFRVDELPANSRTVVLNTQATTAKDRKARIGIYVDSRDQILEGGESINGRPAGSGEEDNDAFYEVI